MGLLYLYIAEPTAILVRNIARKLADVRIGYK
jgi:hypothetical protein